MIESEFARFQRLPRERWRAELCAREKLNDTEKQELMRLLEAHESMPEGFMDAGKVRVRQEALAGVETQKTQIARNEHKAGDEIGSYRLESRLGEGGFGVVWRARQTEPVVREVALKILKLGMDSVRILKRFKAEQQMLAMMEHPNIAQLIEAGMTEDGRPFFAMELVKGRPVTEFCDARELGIRERLEVFVNVCLAVNHAHQKGAIHRDLKPSNILVVDDPSGPIAKVIDFGISQVTKRSEFQFTGTMTARGELLGTPSYMAPEQFSVDEAIDTRADIYSLGAILYELLVGSPPEGECSPTDASGMSRLRREEGGEIMRPSMLLRRLEEKERAGLARRRGVSGTELQSLVRNDLEWIAMKALEREPEARYATVVGLVNDIRKSQGSQPISARPPSRRYIFQKYLRRNRSAVLAGCVIVLALVFVAFSGQRQARKSEQAAGIAEQARGAEKDMRLYSEAVARRAESAEEQALLQRERALRHAYAADMLLAFESQRQKDLRRTSRLLRLYQPDGNAPDLRGWEWRHLWNQTRTRTAGAVGEYSERVLSAMFSTKGESLITFEDHGRIVLRDLAGDRADILMSKASAESRLESSGGFLTASPEGTVIAGLHQNEASGNYHIKIWSDPATAPIRSLDVGSRRPTGVALSPGGLLVAYFIPTEGEAKIVEASSGAVVHTEKLHAGSYSELDQEGACAFSQDGQLLALGGGQGRIVILEVPSWTPLPKKARVTGRVTTLAFSPDGSQLVAGSLYQDPRVSVFDLNGGEDIRLIGHSGFISKVAFSPDGRLLASGSGDQNIKLWRTSDWSEAANLQGHRDEVWSVGFSPDGRKLVSGGKDRSVRIWEVEDWLKQDEESLVLSKPFHHADLAPGGDGALTMHHGTVSFHGGMGHLGEFQTRNLSEAFWISEDLLVCGSRTPAELTVRNLSGSVQERLELPADAQNHRFLYLGESAIMVVLMETPGSSMFQLNRYAVPSLDLVSSVSLELSGATHGNLLSRDRSSFSRDGARWAVRSGWNTLSVYDLVTGQLVSRVDTGNQAGIQGLSLSPNGETLAYAVRKRPVVEIRAVATGRSLARLEGHNLVIRRLDFSPDGERLVSTAIGSEPILLWETTEWEQVASFGPTPGYVSPLAWFLPSGEGLIIREEALEGARCRLRLLKAPSIELITRSEGRER